MPLAISPDPVRESLPKIVTPGVLVPARTAILNRRDTWDPLAGGAVSVIYRCSHHRVIEAFGELIIKAQLGDNAAEVAMTRFVSTQTDLPCPRLIHHWSSAAPEEETEAIRRHWLVVTKIPGMTAAEFLKDKEDLTDLVVSQLVAHLETMRKMTSDVLGPGEGILATGFAGGYVSYTSQDTERDYLEQYLKDCADDEGSNPALFWNAYSRYLTRSGRDRTRWVLTHHDLALVNVMVDAKGNVTGIIDWAHAGFYPGFEEAWGVLSNSDVTPAWRRAIVERLRLDDEFWVMAKAAWGDWFPLEELPHSAQELYQELLAAA